MSEGLKIPEETEYSPKEEGIIPLPLLGAARLVEIPAMETVAGVGSVVAIEFVDEPGDDSIETIYIVDHPTDKPDSTLRSVSLTTSLGRVIIGAKAGDSISYTVDNKEFKIKIVSVT